MYESTKWGLVFYDSFVLEISVCVQKTDCCDQNASVAAESGHIAVGLVIASAVVGRGVGIVAVAASHVTGAVLRQMDRCL